MTRRDLVQKIVLGGAVLTVVPTLLSNCTKDVTANNSGSVISLDLSLSENSTLNTTGGSKITQNVIVVNTGNGNYSALSSICTHAGCTVAYNSASGRIICPCHNGVFTTSGSVISGPPPRALSSYQVSKTGNILSITL